MSNFHKLGLVLIVGGFLAIGASIMTSPRDVGALTSSFATLKNSSPQGQSETVELLRRWSPRRSYSSAPSTSSDEPAATLPPATSTTAPKATSTPRPTATTAPSSVLGIVTSFILGQKTGYQDSGERQLSSGQALQVSCLGNSLSVNKLSVHESEAFCSGSNIDDHIGIVCPTASLSEVNVSVLSRTFLCGTGTVSTNSSNSSSLPGVTGSSSNPAATPTKQPTQTAPTVGPTTVGPTTTPAGAISGGTISNPNGTCIVVKTPGQVIENVTIGPCGDGGIDIQAANVIVRNVTIRQAHTNIRVYDTSGAVIENSRLENPVSSGGGYEQQISIDKSTNVTIRNNTLVCSGSCGQEDAIGIFESSNIVITGNSISGGNSGSGCGVMADAGVARLTITNNTIQNQVNCGIGIANGTDHLVQGNSISGYGNVGIYVWNQYGGTCSRITISNNNVSGSNPWWNGGGCSQVTVTGNNFTDN
jgi:Right handed beta helix region